MAYKGWSAKPRGLDLTTPDVTTLDEWEAWRQNERLNRGWPLPSYDMLGEIGRAADVKRWLLQIREFMGDEGFSTPMVWLQHYLQIGFDQGVVYEVQNCQKVGHTKAEVAEGVAVAFLHAVSGGMTEVADTAREKLRGYEEKDERVAYPESWAPDPEAFASGLDFSNPELTPAELKRLEDWYHGVMGEVPESVQFLSRFRPGLLKAWRNRFEHAVHVMPKQMMPFMLLHYETMRGHEAGIREAVLLARGFGMTVTETCDPIVWAMLYGGHGSAANAWRAARDVLENW
jgi:hypothetical protein